MTSSRHVIETKTLLKYDSNLQIIASSPSIHEHTSDRLFRSESIGTMARDEHGWAEFVPDLPIPISYVGGHYLLFSIKTVSWLRKEHNICGYNVGTLPQSPSQNVFLGLPIMIMPEEAQILVEKGICYILDDPRSHDQAIYDRKATDQKQYLAKARRQGSEVEQLRAHEHAEARDRALSKQKGKSKKKGGSEESTTIGSLLDFDEAGSTTPTSDAIDDTPIKLLTTPAQSFNYHVTPATSRLLLDGSPTATTSLAKSLPDTPSSYPLFRYLHERGYFMTPGLRFGCQYSTYPGDPLRFHSHFLSVGFDWDEEIDLMEIVGGGRLGTGVKKGFLLGGLQPSTEASEAEVRTFSVEWAVM